MPAPNAKHALAIVSPPAIPRTLTRSQVADTLGVSISSVRRLEGDRLHPTIGPDGANHFDPAEVIGLATELSTKRRPRPATAAPVKLSPGELAARAFECFEQRYSLAEVVIALRVEPKVVRDLFHEWQVGLVQGELHRPDVALPPEHAIRHVDHDELAALLAGLPVGEPTRISVARFVDNYEVVPGVSHHEFVEVGGFVTWSALCLDDLAARYGIGPLRVTAFDLTVAHVHWEVLACARASRGCPT